MDPELFCLRRVLEKRQGTHERWFRMKISLIQGKKKDQKKRHDVSSSEFLSQQHELLDRRRFNLSSVVIVVVGGKKRAEMEAIQSCLHPRIAPVSCLSQFWKESAFLSYMNFSSHSLLSQCILWSKKIERFSGALSNFSSDPSTSTPVAESLKSRFVMYFPAPSLFARNTRELYPSSLLLRSVLLE